MTTEIPSECSKNLCCYRAEITMPIGGQRLACSHTVFVGSISICPRRALQKGLPLGLRVVPSGLWVPCGLVPGGCLGFSPSLYARLSSPTFSLSVSSLLCPSFFSISVFLCVALSLCVCLSCFKPSHSHRAWRLRRRCR